MKSLRIPFVTYTDLEYLLLKQQPCQNNPDKSYTEKKNIHEPCGYSLDSISLFDLKQTKHSYCRGRDCIKKFYEEIKELGTKIINYKQKERTSLTDKENYHHEKQKTYYICQKWL